MTHNSAQIEIETAGRPEPLCYQPAVALGRGKLAMLLFLSTEMMFFAAIIGSYVVLRFSNSESWPSHSDVQVELYLGILNTIVLVTSSITLWFAVRSAARDRTSMAKLWLVFTAILAITFLAIKGCEYRTKYQHGICPVPGGTLVYDRADEYYLSRTVQEIRREVNQLEKNVAETRTDKDAKRLRQLYLIQSSVIGWAQHKAGQTGDPATRKKAIETMAWQIYPLNRDAGFERTLRDEARKLQIRKEQIESDQRHWEESLKEAQDEIRRLLPKKSDGGREIRKQLLEQSANAEQLTNTISALKKDLIPINYRLQVEEELDRTLGINEQFQLRLPIVIAGGKAWVNTYFLLTGFHAIHLLAGLVVLVGWLTLKFGKSRVHWLGTFSLYWHFVGLVWLVIFTIIYLS